VTDSESILRCINAIKATFSNNEPAVGTYYYRTTYAGNHAYTNATSNTVTGQETTLTIAATTTTPKVNQMLNFTGVLALYNGTSSTPLTGQRVYLEASTSRSGPWSPGASTPSTTNAAGKYGFTGHISIAGTYYVRVWFAGTTAYPGCVSPAVKVVVSK
jgi:hypothetical protein